MQPRLTVKTGFTSIALALAAIGLPAMAQEGPAPAAAPAADEVRPAGQAMLQPQAFTPPPQVREEWLAECRSRIAWRGPDRSWREHRESWRGRHRMAEGGAFEQDACAAYFDDYYAYYANSYANHIRLAQSAYGQAASCCRKEPDCADTIEYEDVPRRPAARSLPRRAKPVPDKRIKVD